MPSSDSVLEFNRERLSGTLLKIKNRNRPALRKEKKIFKRLEPGFPVFREAVPAIDWPAFGWLERNFAFLATV